MTKKLVPEVKEALSRFKIETAKEIELGFTSFNNPKNLSDKVKLNPDKSFKPYKF
ncbi:alpha/beta-type small acid-soluble spore protein [Clostridium sporogenes]|uniref:Small, acid-soluble spore protein, alpha/beta type n=1 Tax=Clostridium botulinum TaxID=1491 RepID=A0A6M0SWP6_CLOBO|nr:small, acid-soluble spore protein, alpha/beta type [Clostridium sporogenes]NFA59929.1 small, acid-soluble spore protein, alpha/beta type [Clostridium botulinum]NFI73751.1 small, acid-soluble spore protein, alpha/beta type [Clostridium sporogenes]NFL72245.1 small, acid-soluble spore protein, alpha/beta type [Clostridium sporogenes]NFM26077.1 small, acid-soluble spore protein, alpha/beta type [Clostridium sporogenes]NFP61625.1 small, acid-soluble spore protein, alpha/beta type [Clostridium sp